MADEEIPASPAVVLEIPQLDNRELLQKERNTPERVWDRAEGGAFLGAVAVDPEMRRWGGVGMTTGMRPGEQCARRWSHLEGRLLTINSSIVEIDKMTRELEPTTPKWVEASTKTRSRRTIMLTKECLEWINGQRAYVQELLEQGKISVAASKYIFPNKRGTLPYINPDGIYERWRYLIKGNKNKPEHRRESLPGVKYIPPYGLRHTHATDLLRQGKSSLIAAERLGTSVKEIEEHYGHVLEDMKVQEVDSLDPMGSAQSSGDHDPDSKESTEVEGGSEP